MDTLFLVKFGKREHLQQIVDGTIRFSPSQQYIEQEKESCDKGQGDLLEGKLKFKANSFKMYDIETNQLVKKGNSAMFTIAIQDVNNIPIFCMTNGNIDDCSSFTDNHNYTINFNKDKTETIIKDFNPDSALIILNPTMFLNNISGIGEYISKRIKYFEYGDYLYIEQLEAITGLKATAGNPITLLYDERYGHLLVKDTFFKNQDEYRIILKDKAITSPAFYPIKFNSSYKLVSINDFANGVDVCTDDF